MAFCLDTDIIIEFFRGNENVIHRLEIEIKNNTPLYVTHITLCELFRGAHLSAHPKRETERIMQLLESIRILYFSLDACIKLGFISATLTRKGQVVNDADLIIGSIALSRQCVMVTNNTNHFERISGLPLENWLK